MPGAHALQPLISKSDSRNLINGKKLVITVQFVCLGSNEENVWKVVVVDEG